MPMIVGGVTALGLLLAIVVFSRSSDGSGEPDSTPQPTRQQTSPATSGTPVRLGSNRAGKTPDRPAPTLTMEMLQRANAFVDEAKALNNEGTRLRNDGDNRAARAKQSEAKQKIDAAIAVIEAPSAWQEEADLEGWAMPAEYVSLENLFARIAKLQKRIRMGGGK